MSRVGDEVLTNFSIPSEEMTTISAVKGAQFVWMKVLVLKT